MPENLPVLSDALVRRIHEGPSRFVLATTGGGSQAISSLLAVPGASRTVLAASVPYSQAALVDWLGSRPEQFCHESTARLMAMAAYQRALAYTSSEGEGGAVVGIGCTASLVSDQPKRGSHRIHVAAQSADTTRVASLELVKGARQRAGEEEITATLVLNFVAQACRLAEQLPIPLEAGEQVFADELIAPAEWRQLLAAETSAVCAWGEVVGASSTESGPRVVFPGAFHPLHTGHRAMAQIAAAQLGRAVEWELSITNVDKAPLDFLDMHRRAAQFPSDTQLWLTRAPTFVQKAGLFPGATFVVGADTVRRIADPRYYDGSPAACHAALQEIAARGCRFLVFGRQTGETFTGLDDLQLPGVLREICDEVPASAFRADVSSTALRRTRADAD